MTPAEIIRILLIEDNLNDVELLRLALFRAERSGFRYQLTHSLHLAQALSEIQSARFDVILSDLNLPDSEGTDTFMRLLAQAGGTPIVILTGHAEDTLAVQAVQLGVQDFLVKSEVSGPVLGRAIRYAIDRHRAAVAVRRQNDFLTVLHVVAIDLLSQPDVPSLMRVIVNHASRLVRAPVAYISIVDGDLLNIKAQADMPQRLPARSLHLGEGLGGRVWAARAPIVVADYAAWAERLPDAWLSDLRAAAGVPIVSGQQCLGVITVARFKTDSQPFDGEEIELLKQVSTLASLTLHNAQLYEQAQNEIAERLRTAGRLQAQDGVTRILSQAPDLNAAATQILQVMGESLAWDMGELWMVQPERNELSLVGLWHAAGLDLGEFEDFTRQRTFRHGGGFSGRVWASGLPLWMADVMNYPSFPPLAIAARAGLHGGFGFPIQLGGQVLGVITFFSRAIRPPDEDLLAMFTAIGSQIGQFIERRRAEAGLRESEARLNYLIRRFVPSAVADQIMTGGADVKLGGERRLVSVLFADIRGYTSLTETLGPTELMDVLNQYYGIVGRVILKFGGTINQYAGDMIMASFNAPNAQPDHAARAVQAALEAQAELQAARASQSSGTDVHFGMGINTGAVVVGYVGFEDRFDYATLGETTNIAFRFSSMAEPGQVLIGPETLEQVKGYAVVRPLGPLPLKGRSHPLPVFAVEGWAAALP
jgi:class 3 adenylate cyclase/FixJ family two-component response regulator